MSKVVLNSEIRIGPFTGRNIEWYIINEDESEFFKEIEIDGIIGRNILKNFIVNIDYSSDLISLYMHNNNKSVYQSESR